MEDSRSIRKAKRHDLIFKVSISGPKSCLLFITFTNPHSIIGIGEIQLDESLCPTKPIQQLANQRQRILIFDGNIVKTLIIHTKAEASIWLPIKKNKCSGGGFGRPDEAVGHVDFDVSLQSLQLYWPQAIDRAKWWLLTLFQFDGMLIYSGVFWKFRCIFHWKDVAIVGIFYQNLSGSLVK